MQDTHPLTFLGALIASAGWLFLLFGTGGGVDNSKLERFGLENLSGPKIYNIHRGAIASQVIYLGYAVAIAGVISNVGKRIAPNSSKIVPAGYADTHIKGGEPDSHRVDLTEGTNASTSPSERAAAIREAQARKREYLNGLESSP
ncbi:hypothetical protein [Aureimonas sp. N4]|uniref:hypothetical protein n=1 Tax=Aureimonas sp. N4 TaxID=1638165 RepID=UPI0012E34292|nr:hypothetical protein [Aureimonas sp. N4]